MLAAGPLRRRPPPPPAAPSSVPRRGWTLHPWTLHPVRCGGSAVGLSAVGVAASSPLAPLVNSPAGGAAVATAVGGALSSACRRLALVRTRAVCHDQLLLLLLPRRLLPSQPALPSAAARLWQWRGHHLGLSRLYREGVGHIEDSPDEIEEREERRGSAETACFLKVLQTTCRISNIN